MDFGKWLIEEMSPEEKWAIEMDARKEDERTAMLFRLCMQQRHQLKRATHEIARLEALVMQLSR